MDLEIGSKIDLSQYEPLDVLDHDGLIISTYDIEGEMIMNFDWEPGSQWEYLKDDEELKAFVDSFWVGLLDEAKEAIEQAECKTCQESCTLDGRSAA